MCRRLIVNAHAAFQRPLQGRPLYEHGLQSIVPFLSPADGVPFACFLTLHRAAAAIPGQQAVPLAPSEDGVLELVYVLDGNGQVASRSTVIRCLYDG